MNIDFIWFYNWENLSKPAGDIEYIFLKNNLNLSKLLSNQEIKFFIRVRKILQYNFLISAVYRSPRKYSSKTKNTYRLKARNKEGPKKNKQYKSEITNNKSLKSDLERTLNKVINIFHTYTIGLTFLLNNIFDLKDEIKRIAFQQFYTPGN